MSRLNPYSGERWRHEKSSMVQTIRMWQQPCAGWRFPIGRPCRGERAMGRVGEVRSHREGTGSGLLRIIGVAASAVGASQATPAGVRNRADQLLRVPFAKGARAQTPGPRRCRGCAQQPSILQRFDRKLPGAGWTKPSIR